VKRLNETPGGALSRGARQCLPGATVFHRSAVAKTPAVEMPIFFWRIALQLTWMIPPIIVAANASMRAARLEVLRDTASPTGLVHEVDSECLYRPKLNSKARPA
jgi:hypothetical protein